MSILQDNLKEVEAKLHRLEARRKKLLGDKAALLGETPIVCLKTPGWVQNHAGCGKEYKINQVIFIQTLYYVRPYGCTGGGYYNDSEGQWLCPDCGAKNRLIFQNKHIAELKAHFKSRITERE